MANPNRTVWAVANRKWADLDCRHANTWEAANEAKRQLQEAYPTARVLIRSYRWGPRNNPGRGYTVRAYDVPARKGGAA